MPKLVRTSVQLPSDLLEWLDSFPGMTRSEALRLNLERTHYLFSNVDPVENVALKYHALLLPALEDFGCDGFRTAARAMPDIIKGYIRERGIGTGDYKDSMTGADLDPRELVAEVERMSAADRIYLLDCIVDRRTRPEKYSEGLRE